MPNDYPDDLRYTTDHEWARINGNRATIGITAFAVHQLGDITVVELPKEGETFKAGQAMGTVESVKAVSDIFAPLSGKVIKVNTPLADSPETLNEDCHDEGWMVELELDNSAETEKLMTADEYAQHLKDED
jgi:glycine cleavage system H protein